MLTHLGWRPARIDSKKKPLGRFCSRIAQCFEALALEADSTEDKKRRDNATVLLQAFSGSRTTRLVLAGMLADLAHEHAIWMRAFDMDSPEPTSVKMATQTFIQRIRLLFREGVILTTAARDTFTGAVLDFLSKAGHWARNCAWSSRAISAEHLNWRAANLVSCCPAHRKRSCTFASTLRFFLWGTFRPKTTCSLLALVCLSAAYFVACLLRCRKRQKTGRSAQHNAAQARAFREDEASGEESGGHGLCTNARQFPGHDICSIPIAFAAGKQWAIPTDVCGRAE